MVESPQRQDWGEALAVSTFYGRSAERAQLETWIVQDHCRLVALLGMGGLGKTTLSIRLADEQLQDRFDRVIWRSLRHAPPLSDFLWDIMQFLADQPMAGLADTHDRQIHQLVQLLQQNRCLVILDNVESILQDGSQAGYYLPGYEGYGHLLKAIGETKYQSCCVLTSREKPRQIALLEGADTYVRSLSLSGLQYQEGQEILTLKGCFGASNAE